MWKVAIFYCEGLFFTFHSSTIVAAIKRPQYIVAYHLPRRSKLRWRKDKGGELPSTWEYFPNTYALLIHKLMVCRDNIIQILRNITFRCFLFEIDNIWKNNLGLLIAENPPSKWHPNSICALYFDISRLKYRKTPNKRPPPINAPPYTLDPMLGCFFTFLAISRLKMVRFSFRKKLLEGENVLFKPTILTNAHGRLLGVLR